MRKVLMATVAAAAMMAAAVQTAARAGTYIPVPMVPGAVSQIVFSINNHNVVAGSFRDSADVEHGFFGPLDGSNYTVFDFPGEGTIGTQARSINDHGAIVGVALNPKFKIGEEFYRSPNGTFKTFRLNGKKLDGIAQGLNASGTNVGDYLIGGKAAGYIGQKGKYVDDFKLHLDGHNTFQQVSPRGIDDLEQVVVGSFLDQGGLQHGFWQTHVDGSHYSPNEVNYPGAKATALEDISEYGYLTGQWSDVNGNTHAFILTLKNHRNTITDLDPQDGSTSQQAWGTNDNGLVALSTDTGKSYVYCARRNANKCPAHDP